MALLDIQDLTITLNTAQGPAKAVRNLSFSLERGESFGIVGESGCGKSITALAIMGLLPGAAQVDGSIRLDGQDLTQLDDVEMGKVRGNRIAMIFQEPMTSLNPLHTVGKQIAETVRLHLGTSKSDARQRAADLLERVGVGGTATRLDSYPHQFSGGQRQRIMIAMALSCEPDILIADEPTTALDVTTQNQILDLIQELGEETGMGMVLISHDLGVISQSTGRIMVMYGGTAVEYGASDKLFQTAGHPYTKGLFSAIPTLGQRGLDRLPTIPGVVPELLSLPKGCPFSGRCPIGDAQCTDDLPTLMETGSGGAIACWKVEQ